MTFLPFFSDKNPEYVARGLKGTIHNPNTSTEAKESAAERLEQMGSDVPQDFSGSKTESATGSRNLRSTGAAGAGQQHGENDEEDVYEESPDERVTENEGLAAGETNRVIGGYKATLKNPNVSQGAKKHAEEVLRETYS
ncbi:Conidiation protein 6-domain-containing protein [Gymnopilus junonius]|uniref:Conidiation protein 6-domain-containing protein n=1 Tax=Gymnopilus junonius TaxID=109634 RepID=A0A9P5NZB7_GYMJU|nr:Conidiation protein 6-domain-containing protein [Gymnopilus junonius]